jgi:hypothetical protein
MGIPSLTASICAVKTEACYAHCWCVHSNNSVFTVCVVLSPIQRVFLCGNTACYNVIDGASRNCGFNRLADGRYNIETHAHWMYSLFHHLCNWEKGSLKPQFTLIHYSTTPSKCLNNSSDINWGLECSKLVEPRTLKQCVLRINSNFHSWTWLCGNNNVPISYKKCWKSGLHLYSQECGFPARGDCFQACFYKRRMEDG